MEEDDAIAELSLLDEDGAGGELHVAGVRADDEDGLRGRVRLRLGPERRRESERREEVRRPYVHPRQAHVVVLSDDGELAFAEVVQSHTFAADNQNLHTIPLGIQGVANRAIRTPNEPSRHQCALVAHEHRPHGRVGRFDLRPKFAGRQEARRMLDEVDAALPNRTVCSAYPRAKQCRNVPLLIVRPSRRDTG